MEYIKGISLREFYQKFKDRKINESTCKKIFYQICDAMNYLHINHIAHRDIKLENILIDKNDMIKIIDFGFGIYSPKDEIQNFFCGTPNYMSPEIAGKKNYYGENVDLWSLGVLLFKMLVGEFPFKGRNEQDLYDVIKRGVFVIPDFISKEAKIVIVGLLKVNPDKRMNCKDLMKLEWFNEVNKKFVIEPLNEDKENVKQSEELNSVNGCFSLPIIQNGNNIKDKDINKGVNNYSEKRSMGNTNRKILPCIGNGGSFKEEKKYCEDDDDIY